MKIFNKESSFQKIWNISKSTWSISLLFMIFFVFGQYARNEMYIDFNNFKLYFYMIIVFFAINLTCILIIIFLDKLEEKRKIEKKEEYKVYNKKYIWIILIILWIPQWLSVFPGIFNYDAREIWSQFVKNEYSNQYPSVYSMILIGFIKFSIIFFDNYGVGIALYVLFQMILSASVFTYSIYVMEKYNISNAIRKFSIIYYAVFPAIYLYVLSFTKDSLFTILLYLSLLIYLDIFKEEQLKKKQCIVLMFVNTILLLLRHNAIYAYIPFALFLIVVSFKIQNKMQLISLFVLPLIFSSIVNNFCIKLLNIQNTNHTFAMLSIPVQQIAYVYNNNYESLNDKQKEKILEIVDEKVIKKYYPEVSDSILYYTETEKIIKNGKEYFKLWLEIGKNNISNYFNAAIRLNYGYFYPDAIMKIYIKNNSFEERYFDANWFLLSAKENENTQLLKDLYSINYYISSGAVQKIPIIKYIFSIGSMLWIFMFAIFYSIYKKRNKFVYISVLLILLILTYFLGALVMVRYVLILFFALPIFISVIFNNEKFE